MLCTFFLGRADGRKRALRLDIIFPSGQLFCTSGASQPQTLFRTFSCSSIRSTLVPAALKCVARSPDRFCTFRGLRFRSRSLSGHCGFGISTALRLVRVSFSAGLHRRGTCSFRAAGMLRRRDFGGTSTRHFGHRHQASSSLEWCRHWRCFGGGLPLRRRLGNLAFS